MAGNLYKFDLTLEHHKDNADTCEKAATEPETCHMEVYEVPWQKSISVVWENVDCAGKPKQ